MNTQAQAALAPGETGISNLDQEIRSSSLSILVVEDEWLIGEELKGQLQGLGHLVLGPALNCAEALEIVFRTKPDLRRSILATRSLLRQLQSNHFGPIEDLQAMLERGAALEIQLSDIMDRLSGAPASQVTDMLAVHRSARVLIDEIVALQGGMTPMPELPYDVQSIHGKVES